jgi:ABC-type multidrug transport system fused ATPase/permease subunit
VSNLYRNLFSFVPSALRRRFYIAFGLVSAAGMMEILSLSTLSAFFSVGLGGTSSGPISMLKSKLGLSGISADELLVLMVIFFILKAVIVLLSGQYSYRTATALKQCFQVKLFHRFLRLPFQYLAGAKSADWIRFLIADCNALEGRLFVPLLVLLGEVVPTFCVCAVLLLINASIFCFVLGVFAAIGTIVYLAAGKKLVRLGREQQQADGGVVQCAQQAFSGLRELTIYNLLSWAEHRFNRFTGVSSQAADQALSMGLIPAFVFEVLAYFSLGLVLLFYALKGVPLIQVISEFAVFGAAAIRLLPSVSRMVNHLQSFRHARPAVEAVVGYLTVAAEPEVTSLASNYHRQEKPDFEFLCFENVEYSWGDKPLFTSLSFEIFTGDILGIVGPSGAGKSTLMGLMLGLLNPSQGKILLNRDLLLERRTDWWASLGYVPQEPFLIDATLIDNALLGNKDSSQEDKAFAEALLLRLGLPKDLLTGNQANQAIGENGARLSGGQKQRVALARALCRRPQILILDEATSSMDAVTQAEVMSIIVEHMRGRTVVMITHRPEILGYCNKILKLPEGTLQEKRSEHG